MSFECFFRCILPQLSWDSCVEERVCARRQEAAPENTKSSQKQFNWNIFSYLLTFPVQLTENVIRGRRKKKKKTFMKVKAPFAGHPAASSAWPPAEIPSPLGGLESHCNKEAVILRQKQSKDCKEPNNGKQHVKMVLHSNNQTRIWMSSLASTGFYINIFLCFFCSTKLLYYNSNTSFNPIKWVNFLICLIGHAAVCHSGSRRRAQGIVAAVLIKPVILRDQFTVIAVADEQTYSEGVQSSHDAFRLTAVIHNDYALQSEAGAFSFWWEKHSVFDFFIWFIFAIDPTA